MATDILPEVKFDERGRPYEAMIPSKSSPTKPPYKLTRAVSGRWSHVDSRCPAWTHGGKCYHVAALEALYMTVDDEERNYT